MTTKAKISGVIIVAVVATACTGGSARTTSPTTTRPLTTTSQPLPSTTQASAVEPITTATSFVTTLTGRADLEGDGHPDPFTLSGPNQAPGGSWTLQVSLPGGRHDGIGFSAFGVAVWAVNITGVVQQQLLIRTGGNDWTTGQLVVYSGGKLQIANRSDTGIPIFGWTGGGPEPGSTADVACLTIGGQPSFVVTSSEYVPPNWDGHSPVDVAQVESSAPNTLRQAWERTVYHLVGASLIAVVHDNGVIAPNGAPPSGVPLDNRLDCGPAQDNGR
jgi:hypothetical protein